MWWVTPRACRSPLWGWTSVGGRQWDLELVALTSNGSIFGSTAYFMYISECRGSAVL